ncbi:MAG: YkgJ family cysteine cluster protein [Calditrichaceae bacterium]
MSSFQIIDDTYLFECTKCGNCCSGNIRISLNLFDLYKMARFLKLNSTKELFQDNYVRLFKHEEHNVWLTEIQFKSDPLKFCPFLINEADDKNYMQGLCSLHPEHKPLICAMAPVGRVLDFDDDSDQFVFMKPAVDCPGVDEEKENHLSNDIRIHKEELNLQKRFFRILEQLKEADYSREYYLKNLYQFKVNQNFSDVMKSIENRIMTGEL